MRTRALRLAVLVCCSVAVTAAAAQTAARWTVTRLEEGSDFWGTTATAFNERGQVVGSGLVGDSPPRAFLWANGKLTSLGLLPGAPSESGDSYPSAINERGQIVGWSSSRDGGRAHAFLWEGGRMRDLGTLPGRPYSEAVGINGRGQVVGVSYASRGGSGAPISQRAFVWERGKLTDLGTLGGRQSAAAAINGRGQIVGWSETKAGVRHAFLWQSGRMRDLGTLPGRRYSEAVALNERGQVVGESYTALRLDSSPSGFHWPPGEAYRKAGLRAFIWRKGTLTAIALPGGAATTAVAVNAAGRVIGNALSAGRMYPTIPHGFAWQSGKAVVLATPAGDTESAALSINRLGQIVGWSGVEGAYQAYVWEGSARTALPNPGGAGHDDKVSATAINDQQQIIGTRTATMDSAAAVLWRRR